eukprot:TRINITY_DN9197_c0_g1_i1.p1 TRINITY_DN9197_c0_g1~~TRINITY_DN9197_c0_g1_i1.p1  ORF type:complete len:139 (-),score=18.87 TRINITY_DN9197_c0_g1_i1:16-432(-)
MHACKERTWKMRSQFGTYQSNIHPCPARQSIPRITQSTFALALFVKRSAARLSSSRVGPAALAREPAAVWPASRCWWVASTITAPTSTNPPNTNSQLHSHPPVSYTHLRAHETPEHLVCRLLLEKKKKKRINILMNKQ